MAADGGQILRFWLYVAAKFYKFGRGGRPSWIKVWVFPNE